MSSKKNTTVIITKKQLRQEIRKIVNEPEPPPNRKVVLSLIHGFFEGIPGMLEERRLAGLS